jgi:hypothetical protein
MPFFLGGTDLTFDILKPYFSLGDAENLALSFVLRPGADLRHPVVI